MISIPHSGTHLVRQIFHDAGYAFSSDPSNRKITIRHCHTQKLKQELEALLPLGKGVASLRHPYLIYNSWKLRGDWNLDVFKYAWNTFIELVNKYSIICLPIDSPNRNRWLKDMANKLDINLKTDWPIMSSPYKTHNLNWRDIKPDKELIDLVESKKEFLSKYY